MFLTYHRFYKCDAPVVVHLLFYLFIIDRSTLESNASAALFGGRLDDFVQNPEWNRNYHHFASTIATDQAPRSTASRPTRYFSENSLLVACQNDVFKEGNANKISSTKNARINDLDVNNTDLQDHLHVWHSNETSFPQNMFYHQTSKHKLGVSSPNLTNNSQSNWMYKGNLLQKEKFGLKFDSNASRAFKRDRDLWQSYDMIYNENHQVEKLDRIDTVNDILY